MNLLNPREDWTIYNCHTHTFTQQHSPKFFIFWVLADQESGKINLWKIFKGLVYVLTYLALLVLVPDATAFLAGRSGRLPQLSHSFLLLVQAVLLSPLVLLIGLLAVLGLIMLARGVIAVLLFLFRLLSRRPLVPDENPLMQAKEAMARGQKKITRSKLLFELLVRINPASNDAFERTARFLKIAEQPNQEEVFLQVQRQYPNEEPKLKTRFVVLPMDMGFMGMGRLRASIDLQHEELLALAELYSPQIIPFYAADPRHEDLVERVERNLARGKFEGIKIYPNLGYRPDDPKLMEVYKLCIQGDFPVVTHCSPGGIWQWGLSKKTRRTYSEPLRYQEILDTPGYKNLKLNLAHFGGAEEWDKHLRGRAEGETEPAWVKIIYDMIASGKYPNLYTDISYTAFTPKLAGLFINLIDYLKVLLEHPLVRRRVLFGSDYYMVERESISEKEASILLRSRLGEELYKQIAYTNPREFLCIND